MKNENPKSVKLDRRADEENKRQSKLAPECRVMLQVETWRVRNEYLQTAGRCQAKASRAARQRSRCLRFGELFTAGVGAGLCCSSLPCQATGSHRRRCCWGRSEEVRLDRCPCICGANFREESTGCGLAGGASDVDGVGASSPSAVRRARAARPVHNLHGAPANIST